MIRLFAAEATGPSLLVLDDVDLVTDAGAPFVPEFTTAPFAASRGAGGWATFRRLTQALEVGAPATVTITPLVDGGELTGQATPRALDPARGAVQELDVPVFAAGTRYAFRVQVTSHAGVLAFGESDQWIVARRSLRG